MPEHKIHILCTRPVNRSLVEDAASQDITLDVVSFIETEALQTVEVQQEIEQAAIQIATVVFTSMNAVEVVTTMLDGHLPEWNIYCIGHKTKELIAAYFGEEAIAGSSDNASDLAEEIIENDTTGEVIFFCGNRRREELPEKLSQEGIAINEVVVYQTKNVEHKITKKYNAVLFFSPSAVESFFVKNKLDSGAIAFAIGSTTKEAVARFCKNKIIVSNSPGKEIMVNQAIAYFT